MFWDLAGCEEAFPRMLQEPVAWALPIGVVSIPRLWLHDVFAYSERLSAQLQPHGRDRPLRGCLLASRGKGIIFIDGTDCLDERTFTLAHETAHFLLDHYIPRMRLVELLGTSIVEVLDGMRPPTMEERLSGIFVEESLLPQLHTLERDTDGSPSSESTRKMESEADLLAIELIAPESEVVRTCKAHGRTSTSELASILVHSFGLPERVAAGYCAELVDVYGKGTFRTWIDGGEHFVEL